MAAMEEMEMDDLFDRHLEEHEGAFEEDDFGSPTPTPPSAAAAAAAAQNHSQFDEVEDDDASMGDLENYQQAEHARPGGDRARWSWRCYVLQEDGTRSPALQKSAETVLVRPRSSRHAAPVSFVDARRGRGLVSKEHPRRSRGVAAIFVEGTSASRPRIRRRRFRAAKQTPRPPSRSALYSSVRALWAAAGRGPTSTPRRRCRPPPNAARPSDAPRG